MASNKSKRIHISIQQAVALLVPYIKDRVLSQIRSVWLIILYLIFFQTFVLKIAIFDASMISIGIGLVVIGLAFFMEGLFLGLMRLGTIVGIGLPKKYPVAVVLTFGLVLGFLATLAEPSIQVLQMAGKSVKPWEAPLLFVLLKKHSQYLVYAVGAGVGAAVALGMLRFYYNISLKPFIYFIVGALVLLTLWASLDANMKNIIGLAWDCGAVTTGPVTVPLVLALGIGISKMVGSAESGSTTGFGIVTLASLLPIISVFGLGLFFMKTVPHPMSEIDFFKTENRNRIEVLFDHQDELMRYVILEGSPQARLSFFGENKKLAQCLKDLATSESKRQSVFGDDGESPKIWAAVQETEKQLGTVSGGFEKEQKSVLKRSVEREKELNFQVLMQKNVAAALKAIGLLAIPLFLVLFVLMRESLPYPDELFLGILFCILGLATFGIGIELGLNKLGTQIGSNLPASFKAISIPEENRSIDGFDPNLVQEAISETGEKHPFFFAEIDGKIVQAPYDPSKFDQTSGQYRYTPLKGPLFGSGSPLPGIIVVISFAFLMGYGATRAEPALNALGVTVEELTAGTFKKTVLMQSVAVGVGAGIALGIAQIILALPLAVILTILYIFLLLITKFSTEEFVNIGWDSAGVTTGPITVPLVLAMGLGIGSQIGVVEGFGILATASVCPIITVLILGLHIKRKTKAALDEGFVNGNTSGKGKA